MGAGRRGGRRRARGRWGEREGWGEHGERGGGQRVKADVKLANQISPGIISVRAAKHPAAKRETTTSRAYSARGQVANLIPIRPERKQRSSRRVERRYTSYIYIYIMYIRVVYIYLFFFRISSL